MFYSLFIVSAFIGIREIFPIFKSSKPQKRDWKSILLLSAMLGTGVGFAAIIDFELIKLPSITEFLYGLIKMVLPWFEEFMKF